MDKPEASSAKFDNLFKTEHLKHDLKKRSIRGAGATVFASTFSHVIQLVSTVIVARILAPNDFGLVAMVTSFSMFFMMFRNFGLAEATVQREKINHRQISTLFWINAAFSFGLTLLFMGLAPLIAWFYKEPQLEAIAYVISISFLLGGLSTQHVALVRRNLQFYRLAANEIVGVTLSTVIVIFFALFGFSYWALVARRVSYALSIAVGAWLICKWRPSLPSYGSGIKPMLRFGINSLGNYTLNYFSRNLDKILIGMRYGSESLGLYDKAYQLFVAPTQQLAFPLTGVSVATLSRLLDEPEKYKRYYLKTVSMIAFVGMPVSAMLTVAGNDIILLLLGPQWIEAGRIFSIFGCGIGVMLLYSTHQWLHISLDKTDRWLRWSIFAALFNMTAFIIGLFFGAIGVAIAFTASIYILLGPCVWYAGKPINLNLSSYYSSIWKYFVAALVSGLITWLILYNIPSLAGIFSEINIFFKILISCGLCGVLYLLFVIALYQSIQPIIKFIEVVRHMLPNIKSNR